MSRDIEIAIKRFESSDITGIVELQTLISILEKTHSIVSMYLPLDPFNTLLYEASENLAPTCFRHRINEHMISCLVTDLFPNFCYNSFTNRFVRSPVAMNVIEPIKPIKNSVPVVIKDTTSTPNNEYESLFALDTL
jgi:cytoplasmic FMR1 interacting protein